MEKKKIIVYGSLRPGDYNFARFGKGVKPVSRGCIVGYQLYDLGAYPCCVRTGDKKHVVKVDLIEAQDEETSLYIDDMEIGAGYISDEAEINLPDGSKEKYTIYLYEKAEGTLIKSGDWIKNKFGITKTMASRKKKSAYENELMDMVKAVAKNNPHYVEPVQVEPF